MTPVALASVRSQVVGPLLRILRVATLERLVPPAIEGAELDEHVLLESHLVRTPPLQFVGGRLPPL
jgi:hypothetical protein